jgi:hypothetical protein
MKTPIITMLLCLPLSLYSVRYQQIVINNNSGSPITLYYQRTDPGFSGPQKTCWETIIIENNKNTDIDLLKMTDKKLKKRYSTITYKIPNQKRKCLYLEKGKKEIRFLKDESVEII